MDNSGTLLCAPCVGEDSLFGDDEAVDLELAMLDDPIVGVERVLADEHGPGALAPKPLPTPPSMTPAAFHRHCLTHLPYHPGCPICAASRRPNTQHRRSHEHDRVIPLLVGDYGFVRSSLDSKELIQNLLVLRILPYKLLYAAIVPVKGLDQTVARHIATFIKDAGLVHFSYRSDQEHSITSLLEEAIKISGRPQPLMSPSPSTRLLSLSTMTSLMLPQRPCRLQNQMAPSWPPRSLPILGNHSRTALQKGPCRPSKTNAELLWWHSRLV